MNSRKILTIVIAVVVIVLGVGAYFLFFGSSSTPAGTQTPGQTGSLPATANQNQAANNTSSSAGILATGSAPALGKGVALVSDEPMLAYAINASGSVFGIGPTGKIIEIVSGQTVTLSSLPIQNIMTASFSYDGAKVLVNFGDSANLQTSVFDIASKAWAPMPANWHSPTWSPSDYRIAYAMANSNGTEKFLTLDAARPKNAPLTFATLHAQDMSLTWPNKTQIVLFTKPSSFDAGSAWLFNTQTQALTPVAIEVSGLAIQWNKNVGTPSQVGLEFTAAGSGLGGHLSLIAPAGNTLQQITFLTLPSKCSFATQTTTGTSTTNLYCGIPRDQNAFSYSHLPDDYNQMALFTADDVYQINLQNGAINTVFADQSKIFDVSNMQMVNSSLFFINRYDSKLYQIAL